MLPGAMPDGSRTKRMGDCTCQHCLLVQPNRQLFFAAQRKVPDSAHLSATLPTFCREHISTTPASSSTFVEVVVGQRQSFLSVTAHEPSLLHLSNSVGRCTQISIAWFSGLSASVKIVFVVSSVPTDANVSLSLPLSHISHFISHVSHLSHLSHRSSLISLIPLSRHPLSFKSKPVISTQQRNEPARLSQEVTLGPRVLPSVVAGCSTHSVLQCTIACLSVTRTVAPLPSTARQRVGTCQNRCYAFPSLACFIPFLRWCDDVWPSLPSFAWKMKLPMNLMMALLVWTAALHVRYRIYGQESSRAPSLASSSARSLPAAMMQPVSSSLACSDLDTMSRKRSRFVATHLHAASVPLSTTSGPAPNSEVRLHSPR